MFSSEYIKITLKNDKIAKVNAYFYSTYEYYISYIPCRRN